MKTSVAILSTIIFFLSAWMLTQKAVYGDDSRYDNPTQETLTELANCLTEKGWVMYGSFTCSACRAERKAFGKAFEVIKEIECNPNAPNNQVELCLEKRIKKIPTWILEKNGEETSRLEGYQFLEDLALSTGCETSEVE
jgi:hypothetical protein